jgi:hypothetical protein
MPGKVSGPHTVQQKSRRNVHVFESFRLVLGVLSKTRISWIPGCASSFLGNQNAAVSIADGAAFCAIASSIRPHPRLEDTYQASATVSAHCRNCRALVERYRPGLQVATTVRRGVGA